MAPSRRKGASKAAAAAAARRQWKVGDLVLAKVKGFPAWPATVSEPEKWGYSVDWKKVLVFFFGTQQIAFCNPADVEPFTEAKKQSLLTKRHGKGSDFVRAVQEIIDSYEKLKTQSQAEELQSEEIGKVNESKDKPEAPEAAFESQVSPSNLIAAGKGPSAVEDTSDIALVDKEVLADSTPVDSETPLLTLYSSRKRTRDLPLQGELKESLVKKSRSSSRLRDKSKRKSVEVSECDGADLLAFASSGNSIEENGSEVVTVDSDTLSLNEGSTIGDSHVIRNSQAVVGSDIELGKTLDLPVKAVLKGKRKPSRKRSIGDTVERIATIDKEAGSIDNDFEKTGLTESIKNDLEKMGMTRSSKNDFEIKDVDERLKNRMENKGMAASIKNDLEKMGVAGSCPKEKGDEHLPLVKRARVRMSELPSLKELAKTEENTQKEILVHTPGEINKPSSTEKSSDRELFPKNLAVDASTQFHGSMSSHWQTKKDHSFSCSVHGESALPPSKRLHRALEAMCANNAAEEGQLLNAKSSESQMAIDCGVNFIASDAQAAEKSTESSPKADSDNRAECLDTQNNVFGKELSPKLCSLERIESGVGNSQGSDSDLLLPPQKGNAERIECDDDRLEGAENESGVCKDTEMSVDPVSATHEDVIDASPPVSSVAELQFNHIDDASFEKSRCSNPPLDDSREENDMSEVVTEVVNKHTQKEGNNHLGDGVGNHSSPSVTDGGNSLPLASPHNASSGHVSTSDNGSFIQNNGSCSPDVQLHRKIVSDILFDEEGKSESMVSQRPKSVAGKYTELNAALSSFEAMLESLTRTKESIGRATRMALECAKLGLSSKVVDILAHGLESETALNRRVDFFFLVDSILKADVVGLYPSAIQAMLPRLLAAAAPPGNSAHENRRQCLKVLRLWLERKILSESVIRRHMRELDHNSSAVGAYSRRSSRTERSFDDPIREMEGMLVDEYGSNSSFQLPGFCIPSMIKDEEGGSDSDEGSFEAVTPEHSPEDHEISSAMEKHRHILEDVDGELEMEDVAPPCEEQYFERNSSDPFAPPLPNNGPPSSPPLPASPPPLPPLAPQPGAVSETYANGLDSKRYADTHDSSNCHRASTPRMSRTMSDASHYHSSDHRDIHRQIPESFAGPHFHNKNYPLRPPPPPPNNQFSYGREPHFKHRREAGPPPPYSSRHHYEQHWDRENYYNNHERMEHGPYEPHDGWRVPPHSFSGPPYHGKGKYYGPDPGGPPCEDSRYPHQEWRFQHRSMNHRNSGPFRPPLDGPIPVSNRGPGYWPPR